MNAGRSRSLWLAHAGLLAASLLAVSTLAVAAASRTVAFTYSVRLKDDAPAGAGTLRLWIPVPQSDRHQEISDLGLASEAAKRAPNDTFVQSAMLPSVRATIEMNQGRGERNLVLRTLGPPPV